MQGEMSEVPGPHPCLVTLDPPSPAVAGEGEAQFLFVLLSALGSRSLALPLCSPGGYPVLGSPIHRAIIAI